MSVLPLNPQNSEKLTKCWSVHLSVLFNQTRASSETEGLGLSWKLNLKCVFGQFKKNNINNLYNAKTSQNVLKLLGYVSEKNMMYFRNIISSTFNNCTYVLFLQTSVSLLTAKVLLGEAFLHPISQIGIQI